jgi:outer membrane lipoprotein-sorting protein
MRLFILVCLVAFGTNTMTAQKRSKEKYTDKSDAASVKILKQVHTKYASYKSMQMDLTMSFKTGDKVEKQAAKLTVKGDKFKMVGKDQTMTSDGKTLWNHQKVNKELYISDPEEDEMGLFSSPDKLLKTFEKDFISALITTAKEGGRSVYKLEFKPKSRDTDFTKIRVTIDKATSRINRIKIFDRSNTHYTIEIKNVKSNVSVTNSAFVVNTKKLPKGTEVIDMR